MEKQNTNFLYHPQKVIDDAQKEPGLTLVCLYAILFPLWRVDLEGTFREQKPYALLEKYFEYGIFDGKLQTTDELSAFFGIDPRLVAKVLDFLQTIEHVQCEQGRWFLRPLGQQSLNDGQKYIPKKSRQECFFDAFQGCPLTREHYEKIQIYTEQEAGELARAYENGHRGYRCVPLYSFHDWDARAIDDLARLPDRNKYNLRTELSGIRQAEQSHPEKVYLPIYLLEARKPNGQISYLAYSRVRGRRDPFFEDIVNHYPDIRQSLANEADKQQQTKNHWARLLRRLGLENMQPLLMPNGIWQLDLTPGLFRAENPPLTIEKVGTYRLEEGRFLYFWCQDLGIRRAAALERALNQIERNKKFIAESEIEKDLQMLSEQLVTGKLDLNDLKRHAKESGRTALLDIINAL